MIRLLVFGPGYTASRLIQRVSEAGGQAIKIGRSAFEDTETVALEIGRATHILSSVPPEGDDDPVLVRYGALLARAPALWVGYLSSTGVYGDSGGAWIDESAPIAGRRSGRNKADQAWQGLHPKVRIFRLPGIYGPGRSALERVAEGKAHRIILPGQIFSRIHVDDIISAIIASFGNGPPGVYNIADDYPAPQNDVIAYAAEMLGLPAPPLQTLDEVKLSPAARAFYDENRRVANGKARRLLRWTPRYPDYRTGLRACAWIAATSASTSDSG